jgi:hypothetical protein
MTFRFLRTSTTLRQKGFTMLKSLSLFVLIATLAACSNGPPLAVCRGPVFQLNTDHWQAAPADITKPTASNE